MKNQLIKAMKYSQLIDVMYIAKDSKISKRRVKVIKIAGETVQAYCFMKQAKRTFIIDNVLAVMPATKKEREVI
ncbi:transcriptional regulator [Metasolibacillus sp.]|uniref:transcriptional regulator n=1 Tax=Metasolibacillus sp. TaxID=2703680 RepID=UPI0025E3803F|nr:transcriptional regulator [Metasolibacillus sp.]MCT6925603.1 transcriptional regulator [Metasolibacillus sp.]MCT6941758.1 transcriptional regulator [Metasolibacillus sp.]